MFAYRSGREIYTPKAYQDAQFFRSIALEIDAKPEKIKNYFYHPAIKQSITNIEVNTPLIKSYESRAYGDPGVLLACPGSSLAGVLLNELGNQDQKKFFYNYVQNNYARTFLCITEPGKGSDAGNLECQFHLVEGQHHLSGEKCFIGNGAIGEIGIVIARENSSLTGIKAVLIVPEKITKSNTLLRVNIKTDGLRAAQLSYLKFNNYLINSDYILGMQKHPLEQGLLSLIKTFNQMRPCVAALAIGLSQAILDYIYDLNPKLNNKLTFKLLADELFLIRKLLYEVVEQNMKNAMQCGKSSYVKVQATRLVEKIALLIPRLCSPSVFIEHPILGKWYRDAFCFEFMEGTSNIQFKNISQDYLNGCFNNL